MKESPPELQFRMRRCLDMMDKVLADDDCSIETQNADIKHLCWVMIGLVTQYMWAVDDLLGPYEIGEKEGGL